MNNEELVEDTNGRDNPTCVSIILGDAISDSEELIIISSMRPRSESPESFVDNGLLTELDFSRTLE